MLLKKLQFLYILNVKNLTSLLLIFTVDKLNAENTISDQYSWDSLSLP